MKYTSCILITVVYNLYSGYDTHENVLPNSWTHLLPHIILLSLHFYYCCIKVIGVPIELARILSTNWWDINDWSSCRCMTYSLVLVKNSLPHTEHYHPVTEKILAVKAVESLYSKQQNLSGGRADYTSYMKSSGPTKAYPLKDFFLSEAEGLHFDCTALTGSNLESTMRRSHGEVELSSVIRMNGEL